MPNQGINEKIITNQLKDELSILEKEHLELN